MKDTYIEWILSLFEQVEEAAPLSRHIVTILIFDARVELGQVVRIILPVNFRSLVDHNVFLAAAPTSMAMETYLGFYVALPREVHH